MSYRDGKVITDFNKRARTDQSLKGIKTMAKKDLDKANKQIHISKTFRFRNFLNIIKNICLS